MILTPSTAPYRVKYQIFSGRDVTTTGTYWIGNQDSLTECQLSYIALRDETGLGASQFGDGEVFDASGKKVARISYNGRMWPAGQWSSDMKPLAEAPRKGEAA